MSLSQIESLAKRQKMDKEERLESIKVRLLDTMFVVNMLILLRRQEEKVETSLCSRRKG